MVEDNTNATLLNQYLVSVLTDEPDITTSLANPTDHNPSYILRNLIITTQSVRDILMKLKPNKASGPDKINVNILKSCPNFDVPLTLLFRKSFHTGVIPQDWRDADVTPLFKKGSRVQCKNYRPVSGLNFVSKLIERTVSKQLKHHLSSNNLDNLYQSAYKAGHSTETALLKITSDIHQNMAQGKPTAVILLDLSAAFDTIDHQQLS